MATMGSLADGAIVLSALLVSVALLKALLHSGFHGPLDAPNARSLHTHPVPRSGGFGILAAGAIGFVAADGPWLIAACASALAILSAFDDGLGLPVPVRLIAQVAAASVFVASSSGAVFSGGWGVAILLVLALAWMTNLYNFMDGADGLAGGMTVFGFGAYSVAAFQAGDGALVLVSACLAAGALGFLMFNFAPARIFMGDVGSIPLGFLAGAVGLEGVQRNLWPVWFPVLVFSPFVCDATVTLLRRAMRGERVWQAHREHYYQRIVMSGFGHRKTALAAYALMAICAIAACTLRAELPGVVVPVLAVFMLGYAALAVVVDLRCRTERRPCP